MSRLRARLAKGAVDRDLHGHITKAQQALRNAADVCTRTCRHREPELASMVRRARIAQRKLKQALALVADVGYLSQEGNSDPDLTPEDAKYPGWHRSEE